MDEKIYVEVSVPTLELNYDAVLMANMYIKDVVDSLSSMFYQLADKNVDTHLTLYNVDKKEIISDGRKKVYKVGIKNGTRLMLI